MVYEAIGDAHSKEISERGWGRPDEDETVYVNEGMRNKNGTVVVR